MEDKFKFSKKGFWIGIVITGPIGLIYGLLMLRDPERQKEATIIITWSLFWTIAGLALMAFQFNLIHAKLLQLEHLK